MKCCYDACCTKTGIRSIVEAQREIVLCHQRIIGGSGGQLLSLCIVGPTGEGLSSYGGIVAIGSKGRWCLIATIRDDGVEKEETGGYRGVIRKYYGPRLELYGERLIRVLFWQPGVGPDFKEAFRLLSVHNIPVPRPMVTPFNNFCDKMLIGSAFMNCEVCLN